MNEPMPASEAAPLRILVVANLYPSRRSPAFGTFVGARVAALRAAGQRVSVAAITDERPHQRVSRKYLRLALGALWAAIDARVRSRPFDIVEAHIAFPTGLIAWPVARVAGARLVLFCHGSDVTVLPWGSPQRTRAARWLFRHADLVVANSAHIAGVVTSRLGPSSAPVAIISPGIDVPEDDEVIVGGERPRDHIVFVGRLVPGKGVNVLVEAVAELVRGGSRVRLTIAGDGPERERLEKLASSLGLEPSFVGAIAPDAVSALLRQATVVAVPSVVDEGLGLVALEAMAQGALVVASAAGGLAETIVDGETGRLVPPGDVAALAAALRLTLDEAGSAADQRMRTAGRLAVIRHRRATAVAESISRYREFTG